MRTTKLLISELRLSVTFSRGRCPRLVWENGRRVLFQHLLGWAPKYN